MEGIPVYSEFILNKSWYQAYVAAPIMANKHKKSISSIQFS